MSTIAFAEIAPATAPRPDVALLVATRADGAIAQTRFADLPRLLRPGDLLVVNNASALGPSPQPALAAYPLEELRRVLEVNLLAPLALVQEALPHLARDAVVVDVSSDAAVEAYPGWGGYGCSKAALDHLTAILATEHPALRVYGVDPGDMRTQLHQEAFPGEDISDRPPPEDSVPGILALVEGSLPSGRYRAAELGAARA